VICWCIVIRGTEVIEEDNTMKKIITMIVVIFLLVIAKAWFGTLDTSEKPEIDEYRLTPGATLKLDIPNISFEKPSKRVFEIRIPENYQAEKPVPILVWFSPGGGSGSVGTVPHIVDFDRFLIVAIPYPGHKLPRLAIKAGAEQIDHFWAYEKPMLEYVRDIIPHISKEIRIAAGFSSGAHLVGSGLDRDWFGFTDFFTAFVIHEGGYAPDMTYRGIKDEHKILITYGLQNDSYGRVVARQMKKAGYHPTVKKLPNTGHTMSPEAIDTIRAWIEGLVPSQS
jgi:hypothetical protein